MQMVIYLDVLLLSNLWVNYLLLRATAQWTHRRMKTRRAILAAMLGAGFSLLIFLPPQHPVICLAIRFLTAFCMVTAAFGKLKIPELFRQTIWFCILSFLFCGVVYAVNSYLIPIGLQTTNSVMYMDISLLVLLFAAFAAALAASFSAHRRDLSAVGEIRLHLRIDGMDFCLDALADTGNGLRDGFSGRPVVVCAEQDLARWISRFGNATDAASHCKGFRMLTASTVTGTKLLPVFQPEWISVRYSSRRQSEQSVDAMVAITSEQTPAIVPACCLR